jgi:ferric-dicitrate binding protein FerR (iron transport regulator)
MIDEVRILDALRSADPPVAEGAFREQLKRQFVSGAFTGRSVLVALPRRQRHRMRWAVGVAAAASVTIAAAALNQPPQWRALPTAGNGTLVVNGVSFPLHDSAELTRRLRPGSRIFLESTQDLDLVSSGLLAMQISPGTELTLPSPPGRWFGRNPRGSVSRGLVRFTTGRHFDGARLAITTPDATVHVTGTTLAVIAEPGGTCICVLEGTAHVRVRHGEMTRVRPGSRYEVPRGDGASTMGDMREAERPKLLDLRDRLQSVMN